MISAKKIQKNYDDYLAKQENKKIECARTSKKNEDKVRQRTQRLATRFDNVSTSALKHHLLRIWTVFNYVLIIAGIILYVFLMHSFFTSVSYNPWAILGHPIIGLMLVGSLWVAFSLIAYLLIITVTPTAKEITRRLGHSHWDICDY